MEFRILGPLEVEQDGRLLPLGGPRQRALLSLLLLHANKVVSRDRLIDDLWGDERPETARTALQVHVSQLRKVLGSDRIVTRAPGYLVRTDSDGLDLESFERLLSEGRSALQAGRTEEAAETLNTALALWRGPPLAEFEDAPFARSESMRLEELQLAALEGRIEADLELGRHHDVLRELTGLVADHPLRERLRGQLMLALYRCGRQADALEVYRQGRHLLSVELGLEPGEELRRLERAILEQSATLEPGEKRAPTGSDAVPTGTVTFLFTDIEGSTRLMQKLGDAYGELLVTHNRVIRATLSGQGGQEIDRQGDAFFFAFRRARDAVVAAVAAQRAIADEGWPHDADVRVRIGISMGEPAVTEGAYHGLDVVRAARISGAASGGQILVSSATRALVGSAVPDISFRDLGEHPLPELEHPERIYQVVAPDLAEEFPPLTTTEVARVLEIGGREDQLAAAAGAALDADERRIRLFRRSRAIAVVGVIVLVATVVALLAVLTGGETSAATVLPDSVAVIDPKTNRVVATVRVGARPIALAVGEGAVWVANADDGTVSRIDPNEREVVKTIGIGAPASDIAAGEGSVWVANGSEGTLARIDPDTNAVVETLDLSGPDKLAPAGAYSVAVGNGAVWVGSGQPKVFRIDPSTNEIVASIGIPHTPVDIAAGQGGIWLAHLGGRTLRIAPEANAVTGIVAAASDPLTIAVGAGSVWEGEGVPPNEGAIWRIDPATVSVVATIPVLGVPLGIAAREDAVWAAGGPAGTLVRIDPGSGRVLSTIQVGNAVLDVALDDSHVWLAVGVNE